VNIGRSRRHYRSFFSVRVLLPIALFISALENAALAASGLIYDGLVEKEGDEEENFDNNVFIKTVYFLQTFEVPILLIVIFEITYLVHKRRSVNFCGMYFDEGVRIKNTAFMSCMLRNSIRTLATVLLVMGLIVNFDFIQSGKPAVDELAGRAGWWALSKEDWDSRLHLLLSLIPTAVLTLVALYLSVVLWRYGTESSMVVHSSICNPWFYPFFGTLAMGVGQFFDENLYTIMSNAGTLIFTLTILLLMVEVDKDMVAADDFAWFLVAVAQTGDKTRVVRPARSLSMRLRQHSLRSNEEEKMPEDEETGTAASMQNGTKGSGKKSAISPEQGVELSSTSKEDDREDEVPQEALSKIGTSSTEKGDNQSSNQDEEANQDEEVRSAALVVDNEVMENTTDVASSPDQIVDVPSVVDNNGEMGSDDGYAEFLLFLYGAKSSSNPKEDVRENDVSQEAPPKSGTGSTQSEDIQPSNQDEEKRPASLVESKVKENASDAASSPDENVEVIFITENDNKTGIKDADTAKQGAEPPNKPKEDERERKISREASSKSDTSPAQIDDIQSSNQGE